jgi:hypothetical protein
MMVFAKTESYYYYYYYYLFTATGFSPVGSSPYTSTQNTNGHIIYTKITIQNKNNNKKICRGLLKSKKR